MALFGNTGTPTAGFVCRGDGTNQVWSNFTMPTPGGWVLSVTAYFGAFTGTGNGRGVIWSGGGSVLTSGPINSVPSQSCAAGAQTFRTATFATPVYIAGGVNFHMGFWMPSANGFSTSSESGGSSAMKAAGSAPSDLSGGVSTGIGDLGVFISYTPNLCKVRRGGVWVEEPRRIMRGGNLIPATPIKIRRAGAWVVIQ